MLLKRNKIEISIPFYNLFRESAKNSDRTRGVSIIRLEIRHFIPSPSTIYAFRVIT